MSDTRPLVFPMTAGDVVVSAQIVGISMRGDGPILELFEVKDVQMTLAADEGPDDETLVQIVARSAESGVDRRLELKRGTPLLLTGIRRR